MLIGGRRHIMPGPSWFLLKDSECYHSEVIWDSKHPVLLAMDLIFEIFVLVAASWAKCTLWNFSLLFSFILSLQIWKTQCLSTDGNPTAVITQDNSPHQKSVMLRTPSLFQDQNHLPRHGATASSPRADSERSQRWRQCNLEVLSTFRNPNRRLTQQGFHTETFILSN